MTADGKSLRDYAGWLIDNELGSFSTVFKNHLDKHLTAGQVEFSIEPMLFSIAGDERIDHQFIESLQSLNGLISVNEVLQIARKTFLDFIPKYTGDAQSAVRLVESIDDYMHNAGIDDDISNVHLLADFGSFEYDLKSAMISFTLSAQRILEVHSKEKVQVLYDTVHPGDLSKLRSAINATIQTGDDLDCELRYIGKELEKVVWLKGKVLMLNGSPVIKGAVIDVTERHHMIRRLERSEELYKQVQAISKLGNWTLELRTGKITWSDEMYRIFGVSRHYELTLEGILTNILPEDLVNVRSRLTAAMEEKASHDFTFRIFHPSGQTRTLHARGEVLLDHHGKVFKLIGTIQDVTEQKQIEKQLRDNENFIQKITDATPSIIAAYNVQTGKYLFVNKAVEHTLGYPVSRVMEEGLPFVISLIHPQDVGPLMEKNEFEINEADDHPDRPDPVVDFIYRMRHDNGSYRWIHTFGTIFDRGDDNKVQHVLNISYDITDKVLAEQRIAEQENLISHIADASPTILYVIDIATSRVIYINRELTPVLGYQPDEITGIEIGTLYHPDDVEKIRAAKKNSADNLIRYECRLKHKDGGWRWLLINETFYRKENKAPMHILGAALDITDRKEIEKKLYEKTMALQQSNHSLEEFAYVASHDLKEPLRKISAFGDRLNASCKDQLDNSGSLYLGKIINASQRMQQMIDDLLRLSMISAEKTFVKYDLQQILDEVVKTLEVKIEEKKARIEYAGLPSVRIVPSQFLQLFQNLISNSLKFSRDGVPSSVSINHEFLDNKESNGRPAGKVLKLTIADNGIGFNPEFSERIFSIFQRLHGKSEYEGTGIGLAICKKIVENHGGVITASSVPGSGASFEILLPAE